MSLPWAMTPMRSAMRSATSRMCVVMITVPPARARSRSTFLTWRAEPASSPVSGSSRMISRGSCTSAPASATFCRMPLEKPSQRSCACGGEPEPVEQFVRARLGERRLDAPKPGDEFEIFLRRELVVDHRLVGDPRHQPLGRAPGRRAHRCRRRGSSRRRDAAARRSSAASWSCRRRWGRAARRIRRRARRDRGRSTAGRLEAFDQAADFERERSRSERGDNAACVSRRLERRIRCGHPV